MYPNPQDVLPLPPRPDLGQYQERAGDLARACASGDPEAIDAWAARWLRDVLSHHSAGDRPGDATRHIAQLAGFARERLVAADCAIAQAQFVIARAHGFESWPHLVRHVESLAVVGTPVSAFERAADAIVAGDRETVARLLREHPELARARSTRDHRAALLHYVSANGVENYRQVTPPNIVAIAQLLLDAGAAVDAEADVYGGGATTLDLVLTSAHPRAAGVQLELADLLIGRGARIDPGGIQACLANGCPEAAEYLARRGLPLGLVEAAGLGRRDVVERMLAQGPGPEDAAWRARVGAALAMARWYEHADVIDAIRQAGFDGHPA